MNIYSYPKLYDAIHHNYKLDIVFVQSIAKSISGSVLELASGTGRLAEAIIKLGLNYTGLELSEPFFNLAKKKYRHNAEFVQGNMQNFKLGKYFNFIFIGFNSFLHNLTLMDAQNCLKCVRKHLSSNGRFMISVFIPDPAFLYRDSEKLYPVTDYFQFQNSKCRMMEKNKYDPATQINNLVWLIERNGKVESKEYHYSMRMFYPHQMDMILSQSGFIIRKKYGDYDQSPLNAESSMQIYICEAN